ncbi:MAG: ferrous iron transporter B [Gemmatimonadota bacterium]|nr:MAG: ferrous iron transporter B [Gemmatimonadota bacterium]
MTHCAVEGDTLEAQDRRDDGRGTILLVGNPNVGKSVLFRNLTQRYVTVSNYPGTTVEVVRARARFDGRTTDVVDTPGLNDLLPRSDDARVTLEILQENPDATVVQVADAKNLRRALLLTLQLAELGRPMVLVLNMLDELEERGGRIDSDRLAEILGIPVVETIALRDYGTAAVAAAVPQARTSRLNGDHAARAGNGRNDRASPQTVRPLPIVPPEARPDPYEANRLRLERVKGILAETYSIAPPAKPSFKVRLGFWAMHPVKGLFFLAAVLFSVFWFVGLFGAGTLVDLLEVGGFNQRLNPLAIQATDRVLPFPHQHLTELIRQPIALPMSPAHEVEIGMLEKSAVMPAYTVPPDASSSPIQQVFRFVHDFLVGEYGLITMALSYAFAIVLPIVTTFFLVFSLLEDSGYFSRMAIMLNRTLRRIGLNGKAVLPMILGLGCATMATMTTRILETRKERVVTTMLLALAVPCSAQLGVLLAMMATLSPAGAIVWLGLVIGILLAVGWLSARVFGGETSEFILEIPPMRRPQLSNVTVKTLSRLEWYLKEVMPIFVIGTALLFLLDRLQLLEAIGRASQPIVTGWLGLPSEMANAFLVGFMRRDFGAVYILDAVTASDPILTSLQIFVAMVTITLFMPCVATFLMIAREHGTKTALRMSAFIFPFAFLVGGLVYRLGRWLPL